VDGVCCDTACDQPQFTCNAPNSRGTCTRVSPAAPALTTGGLVLTALALAALGVFSLLLRMRRS